MIDLAELDVFVSAAMHLNFAVAAKDLGLSPAQVSKSVARLEQKVKRRLFVRTTRVVKLSREGEMLLPVARQAVEAARQVQEFFLETADDKETAGQIRLTCPHTLAMRWLVGRVVEFRRRFPLVELDVLVSDFHFDLAEHRVDVALRDRPLGDSPHVARKIADSRVVLCASPSYVRDKGLVSRVRDLERHEVFCVPQHEELTFAESGVRLKDAAKPSRAVATSGDFLVELAKAGFGIVARPLWGVEKELAEKSLVLVDVNDRLPSTAIYAVYSANRFMPKRTRLLLDHLLKSPDTLLS
jgi:DNA-binding transcriptional LysR family regulator